MELSNPPIFPSNNVLDSNYETLIWYSLLIWLSEIFKLIRKNISKATTGANMESLAEYLNPQQQTWTWQLIFSCDKLKQILTGTRKIGEIWICSNVEK